MMEWHNLIIGHLPSAVLRHTYHVARAEHLYNNHEWTFDFSELRLWVRINQNQSSLLKVIEANIADLDMHFSRKKLDLLRSDIRHHLQDIGEIRGSELAVLVLQALEDISVAQSDLSLERTADADNRQKLFEGEGALKPWNAQTFSSWDEILNNPHGLDASTISDTAFTYLKHTPTEIREMIPSFFRVLHIESVVRRDLAARWVRYRADLREHLEIFHASNLRNKIPPHSDLGGRVRASLSKEACVEDMVRPRLTFHGTPLRNVASIVKHGFLLPGKLDHEGKIVASPRTDIVYKSGIYSSEEAHYALSYAGYQHERTPLGWIPSMRLFVCATIMGRTFNGQRGIRSSGASVHGSLKDGFD